VGEDKDIHIHRQVVLLTCHMGCQARVGVGSRPQGEGRDSEDRGKEDSVG
jgi:hypothetical protein